MYRLIQPSKIEAIRTLKKFNIMLLLIILFNRK